MVTTGHSWAQPLVVDTGSLVALGTGETLQLAMFGLQVPSFPTKIAMKLVWVWLGEGEPVGHPQDILKGTGGCAGSTGIESEGPWCETLFFEFL